MNKMKQSNTKWLGDIPKTWEISRIGSVYTLRNTKVSDKDYEPLSVTMNGVVPQLESAAKTNAHDARKLVKKGDFAINSRSDRRGSCGIADRDGSVSGINTILQPNGEMNPRYYNWLFHTSQFADEFYANGHGIVDDLWTTGWQEMKRILIPLPPLATQETIANFLDQKCSEIDSLSADIQSQIDVLEEYKKSVITEAVTKGLNPDVGMKDSGIEWIGMIPCHWDTTRIKFHAEIKGRIGFRGYTEKDLVDEGEGAITLSPSNFNSMMMNYNKCTYISWFKYYESPEIMINNGDILFVKTGSSYGKNCLVNNLPMEATINPQLIVFKNIKTNNEFFAYMLQSVGIRTQSDLAVVGGTIPTMSQNKISNFSFALPPINEQNAIVVYLNSICATINDSITDKKAQLETLAEYKKSLIYEYVTGKKEVPENV